MGACPNDCRRVVAPAPRLVAGLGRPSTLCTLQVDAAMRNAGYGLPTTADCGRGATAPTLACIVPIGDREDTMTGETLDLSRFIKERLGDRTASELAREAGVSVQTATLHIRGDDRPMKTSPGLDVLQGYRRALRCRVHPLWDAVGRTIWGAEFDDPTSLLQELVVIVGTEALDDDPTARAAIVKLVEEFVLLARRARR
jgi:hypothetical protein